MPRPSNPLEGEGPQRNLDEIAAEDQKEAALQAGSARKFKRLESYYQGKALEMVAKEADVAPGLVMSYCTEAVDRWPNSKTIRRAIDNAIDYLYEKLPAGPAAASKEIKKPAKTLKDMAKEWAAFLGVEPMKREKMAIPDDLLRSFIAKGYVRVVSGVGSRKVLQMNPELLQKPKQ